MPITTPRTLDLFCGGGGSSAGARRAGAQIVAGIDMWSSAVSVYSDNFPEALTICSDVAKIPPQELKKQIGNIDLLLASPECTNHSCARGSASRSESSRRTAYEVARFAKVFSPHWIVLENVQQMRSWVGYQRLISQLERLEYSVQPVTFNSADFGVPQSRKRLYLICSRVQHYAFEAPRRREIRTAESILDPDFTHSFSKLFTPGRASGTLARAERAIEILGRRQPFILVYYGSDGAGGWQRLDVPLRTVTTLDRFALVKPKCGGHIMRMLQPEELKRAMGFPRSYKISLKSRREKIRVLGNAVCPPVMEYIVKTLFAQQVKKCTPQVHNAITS